MEVNNFADLPQIEKGGVSFDSFGKVPFKIGEIFAFNAWLFEISREWRLILFVTFGIICQSISIVFMLMTLYRNLEEFCLSMRRWF